ncbi:MAG: radical SAM protein [Candidatus Omnitrophica bacterium]|nr:radical SAM protein [Candidatus Omnitrophota bacterium]
MNALSALAARMFATNFKRLPFPYKLTLILTYTCNCRCKMCNIWQRDSSAQMSLDEYREFFQKSNRFSWINLSGGEIFMRPDLIEIVKLMIGNCKDLYLIDFPSTGQQTQYIEKKVREILDLKPKRLLVTLSLDGTREGHDEIRQVEGAWERCTDTFNLLRQINRENFGVYFGLTLSGFNEGQFPQAVKDVQAKLPYVTHKDFHVNVAHESGHYYQNGGMPRASLEGLQEILGEIRKLRGKPRNPVAWLEDRYLALAPEFARSGQSPMVCQALASSVFIDPFGDIYPCSIYDRKAGSLRGCDYDLARFWQENETKNLRKEIEEGKCPQCWTPCEAYQTILSQLSKTLFQ